MSEPTNQVPSEMLKAAAKAVLPLCGWTKIVVQGGDTQSSQIAAAIEEYYDTEWLTFGEQVAQAAFEAAGVLNLLTEREQLTGDLKIIRELYRQLRASILPASCEDHARFSVGCSECRLVQMAAQIAELQFQLADRDEAHRKVIAGECAPDEVHCPCVPHLMQKIGEVEKDAARYRWLREQHWNSSPLAVVRNPKDSVKLGRDLPSRERLDEAIDEQMKAPAGAGDGE